MLRSRFMLALSKASERLNKWKLLFIAGKLIGGTLNFWAPLSNQNFRIIRSIFSITDTMEQHHFIIRKITKNFSKLYDCAMSNTPNRPYFLACQKICWT